jgi:hypothetical protein
LFAGVNDIVAFIGSDEVSSLVSEDDIGATFT